MVSNVKDITGQRFGRLVAIKSIGSNKHKQRIWECICDCGKTTNVYTALLLSGNTKSCGCLHDEMASKRFCIHRLSGTILNKKWKNMKQRCYNPKNHQYHNYGGRGVKICEEWLNSFDSFQKWAFQNGYEDNLTIERKNVNGNYEPSNCEWVPFGEQYLNKRCAVKIIIDGKEHYIKDLAEKYGIPYETLWRRYRDRWDLSILFNKPKTGFKRQYHT